MDPVTVAITIDRPREEIFEYLADIANHAEFSDHYLQQWHLTRPDSWGEGAGARFRLKRRNRFAWSELTFIEVTPPHRIVGAGRGGKYNRTKTFSTWTLDPTASGTRVEYTTETEPRLISDRIGEVGLRGWSKRQAKKALKRMREILEEDGDRGRRTTIAGL